MHIISAMKKKTNDMSLDMFHDAMSSTPIPVFTNTTDADAQVNSKVSDDNHIQELIKINWENQTLSARALHKFLVRQERFSSWCKRYLTHGFVENVDFTPIKILVTLNRNAKREYDDFLLTVDMAKRISIMQRNEKGTEACNYLERIEKLFSKKELNEKLQQKEETKPLYFDKKVNTKSSIRKRVIKKIIEQRKKI